MWNTKCLHCLQQAFSFFFLFKEKQLTWRQKNWTTKPQQGERNGLKDELGGMSYPSPCWLLGAGNEHQYGDLGRNKDIRHTGFGRTLEMGKSKHETIARNGNSHKNGFWVLTQFSSGNIAVGGLWLQEVRKWTQTFWVHPPTAAGVNQARLTAWRVEENRIQITKTTKNREQHHVSVHVFMSHAACPRGERAER